MTAVGYPLEHFYYGQLIQQNRPAGELRALAASPALTTSKMSEVVRSALLPPLNGVARGSWALLRRSADEFTFVQSQVNRAGAVILHIVLIPADVIREQGGNIRGFMHLLQSDMPVFETAGERHEPVILPAVGPPGPKAQVDAMLALMSCTRDRSDVIEQLLAAVVRGLPLIVHNAPPNPAQRAALVEGLLALLPASARTGLTFAMHALPTSRVNAQIRFHPNGETPPNAIVFDWAANRVSGERVANDYSRFIVSQFRLDPELATDQTNLLTPIAAWRIERGDSLDAALDYASYRLKLDNSLLNSLPVPAREAVRILTEDPTLDETLRTAYARHVMAFAVALEDMEQAEPIALMLNEQPALEASTLQQMTDALQNGKAEFVFQLVLRWLQNPLGPRGMEWISTAQAAALVHLQTLVKEDDAPALQRFLLSVHQAQDVAEMAYIMPRMLETSIPVAQDNIPLSETVFVLAVNYASAEQLQRLLNAPVLVRHLPEPLGLFYDYLTGEKLGEAPPKLLVRAALSVDAAWRTLVLIRLVELALLGRRQDLVDASALAAMAVAASSPVAEPHDGTFRWLVRTLSTDDNLPNMDADSVRSLLQILLARQAYAELSQELARHSRVLYGVDNMADYALLVRRLFLETPLAPVDTFDALRNLEAGGLKPLPLAMAHFGALKRMNWPDELQEVATNLTVLLSGNPVVAEAIPMAGMFELFQFHARRRDLQQAVQMTLLLPLLAAHRGDAGLTLISQSYRLLDWDNQARLAGLEMLRHYIRTVDDVYVAQAVDRLTAALGEAIRPQLDAAHALRLLMDGETLSGYAVLLHTTAQLLADTALVYIDKKSAPSLKALFGDLDSLVGGLSDDDRDALATAMLELGRAVEALGRHQHQNRPRDANAHTTALVEGHGPPQTALDVMRLLGGVFTRGRRINLPLVQAPTAHPFRDRAAPSLLLETQMAVRTLHNALDAFPPGTRITVTPDALRSEIDSLWLELGQAERRGLVQDLGTDFQTIPDLVWQIFSTGDNRALEENSGLARKLDANRQRPESVFELFRFVHGYFRLRQHRR